MLQVGTIRKNRIKYYRNIENVRLNIWRIIIHPEKILHVSIFYNLFRIPARDTENSFVHYLSLYKRKKNHKLIK